MTSLFGVIMVMIYFFELQEHYSRSSKEEFPTAMKYLPTVAYAITIPILNALYAKLVWKVHKNAGKEKKGEKERGKSCYFLFYLKIRFGEKKIKIEIF